MKILVFLAALLFATPLAAGTCPDPIYTYKVRAVAPAPREGKTCGATTRMLRDSHRITVRDGEFYVNGMRWANLGGSLLPGEAYLAFHQGQHVWLTMWVYANDNKIVGLYALNDDLRHCQDVVRLEGVRK